MPSQIFEDLLGSYQKDFDRYETLLQFTLMFEKDLGQVIESEKLEQYMIKREKCFEEIQQRDRYNASLRNLICQELRISEFTITNLKKSKIRMEKLNELEESMDKLENIMNRILTSDQRTQERLTVEREATRLELHRIRSSKLALNAYVKGGTLEAQFVDKNK